MQSITLTRPDDMHTHFRDGDFLKRTVQDHARQFARAIIMPNLSVPVTTVALAEEYYRRIIKVIDSATNFTPLMTLYLTDKTDKATIQGAAKAEFIHACKLYPAGVTTGSEHGVNTIEKIYPVFEAMQDADLVLCIHGEVNHAEVDVFDRESRFIEEVLSPIRQAFPELRIVLEHITTRQAVEFITGHASHTAATITPHHLALNRNDMLGHGIRPHYFCLPILKRSEHQQALLSAAVSGDSRFFLGTDSAPHTQSSKLSACGCAGIYSGFHAMEIYAELFEDANALDKLEDFASTFGAQFYGLEKNTEQVTLVKKTWEVPQSLPFGDEVVIPLFAGQTLQWQWQ